MSGIRLAGIFQYMGLYFFNLTMQSLSLYIKNSLSKFFQIIIISRLRLIRFFMILDIDYHSGVPIYRQIIDQVREQIMAGMLKDGDQLMPLRELSAKLAINPMTVSRAYSAMEAEGLLERRRGIGLFVKIEPQQKDKTKEALVETLLNKAVVTATQFGLSKKKIHKILDDLYSKYQSEERNESDE